ncbi:MAG: HAD family hydrolase, partial [Myxococcales bacterium]|nr:HAD family hydrolase [Myxococcales bacterium]
GAGVPVPPTTSAGDLSWFEALEAERAEERGIHLTLDLQGIHCAACVWLLDSLFTKSVPGGRLTVNPVLGKADIVAERVSDVRPWLQEIRAFGYAAGPSLKGSDASGDGLLLRTGICAALAMNSMMFAAAIYLGLAAGPLHDLMQTLNYGMALVSVAVGGSVFIEAAWRGLRAGVIHLDLPIAVGIVLAFAGSTAAFWAGREAVFFDSLSVFIALMLAGRWLRERIVAKNQRLLLASGGAESILTRRLVDGRPHLVPASSLSVGDRLLLTPGDLLPVRGTIESDHALCSLDWIDGESAPRSYNKGDEAPAGAFNAGRESFVAIVDATFDDSGLPALLEQRPESGGRWDRFWGLLGRYYVIGVLGVAFSAAVFWWWWSGDPWRAIEITTAVLVVTCPCAFGIAVPLAYELVYAGLRRSGLFVRSQSYLDRARSVRRVVFDKTGTVTTGLLEVTNPEVLELLSPPRRQILFDLVARSPHPKSAAIQAALEEGEDFSLTDGVTVLEEAGDGVAARIDGHLFRLGRPGVVGPFKSEGAGNLEDVEFSMDGVVLTRFRTREDLRPGAGGEIERLLDAGFEVALLSGDHPDRVRVAGHALGLSEDQVFGGMSPADKAQWIGDRDRDDTLMVGDGINDGPAASAAYCSGTPAIDRPFMPARTDFYWTQVGLGPVALSLRASQRLAQILRRLLAFALLYNGVAVAAAFGGLVVPWVAAVIMPLSSVFVLLMTSHALGKGSSLWKYSFSSFS